MSTKIGKYAKSEYRREFPYSKDEKNYDNKDQKLEKRPNNKNRQTNSKKYKSQKKSNTSNRRSVPEKTSYQEPAKKRPSTVRKEKLAPTTSRKEELLQMLEEAKQNRAPAQKPKRTVSNKTNARSEGSVAGKIISNVFYLIIGVSFFNQIPIVMMGIIAFFSFRIWMAIKSGQ